MNCFWATYFIEFSFERQFWFHWVIWVWTDSYGNYIKKYIARLLSNFCKFQPSRRAKSPVLPPEKTARRKRPASPKRRGIFMILWAEWFLFFLCLDKREMLLHFLRFFSWDEISEQFFLQQLHVLILNEMILREMIEKLGKLNLMARLKERLEKTQNILKDEMMNIKELEGVFLQG